MFYLSSNLKTYNIHASDGEMGKVKDLYFDDKRWAIRYAIIDTRKWLPGRRVLLSPSSFLTLNEADKFLEVEFDKETVRNSPSIPDETLITQDVENSLVGYYGWTKYWTGNMLWGPNESPMTAYKNHEEALLQEQPVDSHRDYDLRSEDETIGFKVHADNGKIGTIADMIYDDQKWKIQYIIVQSSDHPVEEEYFVFPTEDIESADWFEHDLYVKKSLEEVKMRKIYKTKESILIDL
ncbi:hypothetical protein CIL05_10675 [Virgibacillus profundi]|uniref:PRC-barrel domain-containing protein n=1 Tax=Virgibacillus profundi TaxID=2024555 RepID=A0A2A2IDL7_9BACI|nr:PRC-barrel domain-containing protein [Virgibacillus profundi]PAV29819.1 hypothetical protein CIL05_10675 [Virgibacillus profundi]PXY53990.1 PRC-barrel domain containing protein [Virgibacillus profundi]